MAEAFLGLKISVLLHSGIKLEGVVSQLEPSNQQMTLKDVTLYFFGQPPHYTPIYGVVGKDIKDIQMISNTISRVDNSSSRHHQHPILNHHVLEQIPPSVLPTPPPIATTLSSSSATPMKSISKHRKLKQQQQQQQSYKTTNNNSNKKDHDGWAREDVNIFREQEFDFQANLDMFDKQKVFAEIRQTDETAPEQLLVTLNRLPVPVPPSSSSSLSFQQKQQQTKLLPSENVLELQDRIAYFNDQEDDFGDESDNDSQTPSSTIRSRRNSSSKKRRKSKQQQIQQEKKTVIIKTKKTGMTCFTITPLEMAQMEHECNKISNHFDTLLIENSGRGTALLILQLLQQQQQQQHIVILCGNNKNGAIGLVAACHLVNHGYTVTCCLSDFDEDDYISNYQLQAQKYNVSLTSNLSSIIIKPHFIVDAILGSEEKLTNLEEDKFNSVCNLLNWIHTTRKTTLLSIDFPTGVDSDTGIPFHPEYVVTPNYTICLGAPKSGCKSRDVTGDLYLLDVGIPRLSWKKIGGVKRNNIPWGADFLVALEYAYQ